MGTTNAKGSNYAWAVAIACVCFYAVPLGLMANHAGLFLTPVINEFGWSQTEASLYMSIQPWVAAVCTPFAGKLLSKYNPRIVMTIAALVFGLSSLACAWFTSPIQWHIYGVLYGASAAFWMYIATPTMVNRWFAKNNGTIIGVIGVFVSLLGAIMSPIIGGWIAEWGWQQTRIVLGIAVTIISAGGTLLLLRESPEKMGVLPWGYGEATEAKQTAASKWEVGPDEGCMQKDAIKSPALWMLVLMAGLFVLSASFNQQAARYAAVNPLFGESGAAIGAMAVSVIMYASIVGKFGLGWIADHFGARVSGITAGVCGLAGAAVIMFSGGSVMMFYVGAALFGLGYSALNIVPPMACRQAFGQKDYANIYSIVATGLNVLSGFAALMYATLFDLTGGYQAAMVVMMVFYALVILMSMVIVPMGRKLWAKNA